MTRNNAKLGWTLALAGLILLMMADRLNLSVLLAPIAVVLALIFLGCGRRMHATSKGLK